MSRIILSCISAGITWTVIAYQIILTHNWLWLLLLLANILWAWLILWGMSDIDYENEYENE
jgi:hypothetical protein